MTKSFFLTVLMLIATLSHAQTVNDIPIKDLGVEYIQIVGQAKMFSNKLNIELDFGQQNKAWSNKEYQVKDADGKKIEFNSMIDALNFMSANGYEFVQAYAMGNGSERVYHYMLRKKKK